MFEIFPRIHRNGLLSIPCGLDFVSLCETFVASDSYPAHRTANIEIPCVQVFTMRVNQTNKT